ncbi:hypothetical protein TREMEDRAFT_62779 [Tremella mesenterica DSM 1558]|uniref:uncharacterized protein n=1 Tax=Tremella mesenterica (strain ATCC 24925 / CBS 8224 / DSM 1558 / NBRC 9311 / NRRL Y-6157 / RJB 2259-6 / UBC 559-6) TaxID=578456 RepID=UPI0003F4A0BC|nr:uncharacterized protein TREMEDRAFT_62779 [Tremella mesenterica DSM 1558]EIW69051.1 hypothetical protein TREMEDRAFT_62779 [Tremella mesenterica DSM 1558]
MHPTPPLETEAGPSRLRRLSIPSSRSLSTRPISPSTELLDPPSRPSTPHLDLVTFSTPTLLHLLAALLQQIAVANDQLRPPSMDLDLELEHLENEDMNMIPTKDSPTTALFDHHIPSHHGSEYGSMSNTNSNPSPPSSPISRDSKSKIGVGTRENDNEHEQNIEEMEEERFKKVSNLSVFTASKLALLQPSSLLSFHARHIPSISIEAYLLRILKYCPTTNEVFLSLLVYFDRMSRLGTPLGVGGKATLAGGRRGFAIDSYNVHRLVIAGVTVASKFFSDVFYTNSRYAKVGGLPPNELNQLELQFLLLNDFRLAVPCDEMQQYGDRLLGYWEGKPTPTQTSIPSAPLPKSTSQSAPSRPTVTISTKPTSRSVTQPPVYRSTTQPSTSLPTAEKSILHSVVQPIQNSTNPPPESITPSNPPEPSMDTTRQHPTESNGQCNDTSNGHVDGFADISARQVPENSHTPIPTEQEITARGRERDNQERTSMVV